VKFSSDENGWVTGIRFYKSAANAGTHTGSLWTASGTQLATGTFTGESASGWQTLQFAAPVAVTKNTVYVASYFAPQGHYADSEYYFWNTNGDAAPLHPVEGSPTDPTQVNGVYTSGDRFPNQTFRGSNYYVDVLFGDVDTYPPSLNSTAPAANDGGVPDRGPTPRSRSPSRCSKGHLTFTLTDDSHHTVPGDGQLTTPRPTRRPSRRHRR
jgi:hypothetical protein